MFSFSACALACVLSGAENVVLMEFTADWCGACRTAEPTVKRLVSEGYPIHPVNIDREPQLAAQFGVRSVPCFVLVRGGQEIDRVLGAASYDRLVQMFQRAGGGASAASLAHTQPTRAATAVRAQSPDSGRGLSLPRPLASIAKNLGGRAAARRQKGSEPDPIQITQSDPGAAASANMADNQPPAMPQVMGNAANFAMPGGQTAPATSSADAPATQRALAATVRLRVEDSTGSSLGTGTIIDSHGEESLVVTCAHIFRESNGQGRILVDLFTQGGPRTVEGAVISFDLDRDVALVAIANAGSSVTPMRVAPPGYSLAKDQPVFSVGCDRGADPSVRASRITSIDRYVGAPNIEVAGMPIDGRSGGGLFSQDGFLIGVCNGADPQDQEGIYASLPIVHWELDKIGQRKVYDPQSEMVASLPQRSSTPGSANQAPLPSATMPTEMPQATVAIAASESKTAGEDLELICIMRSKNNPQGSQRLIVFERPSRELLDRLDNESQRPSAGALAQANPGQQPLVRVASNPSRSDPRPRYNPQGQTIRAQSN